MGDHSRTGVGFSKNKFLSPYVVFVLGSFCFGGLFHLFVFCFLGGFCLVLFCFWV